MFWILRALFFVISATLAWRNTVQLKELVDYISIDYDYDDDNNKGNSGAMISKSNFA